MTIRHPAFWFYLLCLLALGVGTIGYILATQYHPSLELRDALIVLDTDTTSISVQWSSRARSIAASGSPCSRCQTNCP